MLNKSESVEGIQNGEDGGIDHGHADLGLV
jgi:hypothetical protein